MCPTLCDPMDCSLPGSSLHGILQARILKWVAISFSRESSQLRDWTWVSCTAGRRFNLWVTREECVCYRTYQVFILVVQLLSHGPILWDSTNCSTPGFPVLHYLPEFAQTHIHWVGDAIQPFYPVIPFSSCLQSFPASGSFPMSQLFASGGQQIGASASILTMNIQDGFPSGLTGLFSLLSKEESSLALQFERIISSVLSLLSEKVMMAPYSSLENPMDGGAWWAAVHGVTMDWATWLSDFTFTHWRRKWQPIPVFLPGESQGWGSLVGCRLWGRTESDTTEAT